MKAWNLKRIGEIEYEDVAVPEIDAETVLVQVKACGVCSSDIPRIFETGTYHFPTIPGHEFCGIVVAVGEKVSSGWVGKRVGVFPLIPCFECNQCISGNYELCEHYDYLGSRSDGAFAEYVKVPVWNLIELPADLDFKVGALLEPAAVAEHAIVSSACSSEESVAVVGSGLIGIFIALWAQEKGAHVRVVARNDDKRKLVEGLGLEYVNFDQGQQCGNTALADVCFEAVGSSEALGSCLCLAKPLGRIVLVGNPKGDLSLPKSLYWRILRQQLRLVGSWNSSFGASDSDWAKALRMLEDNQRKISSLVTHVYELRDLDIALRMMRDKTEPYVKVMVVNDVS